MSCDCHLHVFGDPARYPDRHPNPVHKSLEATWEDALAMHRTVGFGRGVFVQPANYVTDHTYLKEALARVPRANYRATGIIDDNVSDAELLRLHEAGMRGIRFNFVRQFKMAPSPESFARALERIRPYGWYAKLFIGTDELPDYVELFRPITTPILIDHIGRTLYEAAPDRCIFGTDWPHTHSQKEGGGPQEDALIDLVYRFLPDEKARRAVLVDNPARLHGFE